MRRRRTDKRPPEWEGFGWLIGFIVLMTLFWVLWLNEASAAGRLVFLEDERDLGNGMKHCIYTDGVIITIPSYKLCPISIEV